MEPFSHLVKGEERRAEQEGERQRIARTKSRSLRLPALKMEKKIIFSFNFFRRFLPSS